MYRFPVTINDKKIMIEPYNTEREKDILIMSSFEIYDIDEILRVLGVSDENISILTENEKKVLLYKFREISVGDEILIKFKCSECGQFQDGVIKISDLIISGSNKYKQLDEEVTDSNIHLFVDLSEEEINNLDIDEYEQLIEDIKASQVKYDFIKKCNCIKCQTPNSFFIEDTKYIIESLSEDTLMSMYRTYNDMCMFGNYNKKDIDSLYPFERTILIGLINKTKEDMSK